MFYQRYGWKREDVLDLTLVEFRHLWRVIAKDPAQAVRMVDYK